MSQTFTPQNDLEQQLLAAQEGRLGEEEFMHALLSSQVFMPIYEKHAIGGLQTSQSANPLTVDSGEGFDIIVLFTSPERAKFFTKDYPGYEGGLLAEFTWVLEKMGAGLGLTINPGLGAGLDMTPETVNQLLATRE
ncbi:MAG: SseB family protein [Thiohalomonadaceae bacterium]